MSCAKLAVAEGKKLRAAITAQLETGPKTNAALSGALDTDPERVRAALQRMIKYGHVRSVRGQSKQGWALIATYHLADKSGPAVSHRNVAKACQPVLQVYDALGVRDPFALPAQFFAARQQ